MMYQRQTKKPKLSIFLSSLLISFAVIAGFYFVFSYVPAYDYIIRDTGSEVRYTSTSTDPDVVLQEAAVTLSDTDRYTVASEDDATLIQIVHSNEIELHYHGSVCTAVNYGGTIAGMLSDLSMSVGENDVVTADGEAVTLSSPTYDGMCLDVSEVIHATVTETESLAYGSKVYVDPTLEDGATVLETEGCDGVKALNYSVTYVNGEETERTLLSEAVLSAPVDEVTLIGTSGTVDEGEIAMAVYTTPEPEEEASAASDAPAQAESGAAYAEAAETPEPSAEDPAPAPEAVTPTPTPEPAAVVEPEPEPEEAEETPAPEDVANPEAAEEPDVTEEPAAEEPEPEPAAEDAGNSITLSDGTVFSYSSCATFEATAYTGGGTTATGTSARYGAIAVDPSVIPYGTRMYIVTSDGSWIYGVATAEDCGGAIKGNIIDLYFDSYDECINFGRRDVTVYFLN